MSNSTVRLPEDWRRFDLAALYGALLLPVLLGLLWLAGMGPWDQQACVVATRPLALDISRDQGRILLTGSVATADEKDSIARAAEKIYGKQNVTDRITVDPRVAPIAWTSTAATLLEKLNALTEPAKASIRGDALTLAGAVASTAEKKSKAQEIAAILGTNTKLKNELVVKTAEPKPAPAAPAPAPEPPVTATPAAGTPVKHRLPDGIEITILADGVESQVIAFIEDGSRAVDKGIWFDFDRLQFETGSSKLTERSKDQVGTMAAILKAYPNVAIKIGGYTDNVGDSEFNLKLSDARALRVKEELTALGIAADRLESEGYGQQHPVASNDTAEGRAKNRRTAVSVRQK